MINWRNRRKICNVFGWHWSRCIEVKFSALHSLSSLTSKSHLQMILMAVPEHFHNLGISLLSSLFFFCQKKKSAWLSCNIIDPIQWPLTLLSLLKLLLSFITFSWHRDSLRWTLNGFVFFPRDIFVYFLGTWIC